MSSESTTINQWIKVSERMPDHHAGIVMYIVGASFEDFTTGEYDGEKWWECSVVADVYREIENGEVTHWMPLPDPPTEVVEKR
jgi:hypothetical protein